MPRVEPPYSEVGDLLLGDLRLSSTLDPNRIVLDAADEIDSILGQRYVLPLDLNALENPADRLALKRINNWLASGRLITEVAAAQEDTALHAYGASLIRDALAALAHLDLAGLPEVTTYTGAGPTVYNEDDTSGVAAFYDHYGFGGMRFWQPGKAS